MTRTTSPTPATGGGYCGANEGVVPGSGSRVIGCTRWLHSITAVPSSTTSLSWVTVSGKQKEQGTYKCSWPVPRIVLHQQQARRPEHSDKELFQARRSRDLSNVGNSFHSLQTKERNAAY